LIFLSIGSVKASQEANQSIESLIRTIKSYKQKTIISGNETIHLMDYNKDGKIDAEYHYIDGVLFSEKLDLNQDEKWDKSHWYYRKGNILKTSTIDSNLDGKVDLKIVQTREGAKKGHFIQKTFIDKDFDGKFDTKKVTEINNHQAGVNATRPNEVREVRNDETECNVETFNEFYPATLKKKIVNAVNHVLDAILRDNEEAEKQEKKVTWNIDLQKSCKTSPQHKKLVNERNFVQGLKTGLTCMHNLSVNVNDPKEGLSKPKRRLYGVRDYNNGRRIEAKNNFYKAVAGLFGHDFLVGLDNEFNDHGRKLTLICEPPKVLMPFLFNRDSKNIYARATVASGEGIESHENHLNGYFPAPNIVFSPKLKDQVMSKAKRPDYPGEDEHKIMQKLIFHEYLHTALGTTHSEDSVDMAETCATFCFNKPSKKDELGLEMRKIGGEICGGNFSSAQNDQYKENIKKFNCYQKLHRKFSDKEDSKIPTSEECDEILDQES